MSYWSELVQNAPPPQTAIGAPSDDDVLCLEIAVSDISDGNNSISQDALWQRFWDMPPTQEDA